MKLNWCRVCQKQRTESYLCNCCATPLVAYYEPPQKANGNPKCPGCGGTRNKPTIDDARLCLLCGAMFEPVEFLFSHSDPEINAQRQEEYAIRHTNRNRPGRRER